MLESGLSRPTPWTLNLHPTEPFTATLGTGRTKRTWTTGCQVRGNNLVPPPRNEF